MGKKTFSIINLRVNFHTLNRNYAQSKKESDDRIFSNENERFLDLEKG